MKAIILAAGLGTRLNREKPKTLLKLPNGKTLLEHQVNLFRKKGIKEIIVVVGFKKEIIMETVNNVLFVYNPLFHVTNTAKSLEKALDIIEPDEVIWVNGDVFFEEKILDMILNSEGNSVIVNKAPCGWEEVKYRTNSKGEIIEISKKVKNAEGEALGIYKISKKDFPTFLKNLKLCGNKDYFEKAIELSIKQDNVSFKAVDIGDGKCVEIDFKEDIYKLEELF
jgi:choline kinase